MNYSETQSTQNADNQCKRFSIQNAVLSTGI
jgi:hypothetical protein